MGGSMLDWHVGHAAVIYTPSAGNATDTHTVLVLTVILLIVDTRNVCSTKETKRREIQVAEGVCSRSVAAEAYS